MQKTQKKNRRAMTLMEVLIVGAVVGILVAILMPVLTTVRYAAYANNCKNNLRQLFLSHVVYAGDWRGTLPPSVFCLAGTTAQQPWYITIAPYCEKIDYSGSAYQANSTTYVAKQVICPRFIKQFPKIMSGQNNCKGYVRNCYLQSSAAAGGSSDYSNNTWPTTFKLAAVTMPGSRVFIGDGYSEGTGSSEATYTRFAATVMNIGYQYNTLTGAYVNQYASPAITPLSALTPDLINTQDLHHGRRSYGMCDGSARSLSDDYTQANNQLYLGLRDPVSLP
jgi:type II secretory pathway pseudopilin PulG